MQNEFITYADYPDPDVIRVGDTYYMVTTTMYFMPGCEILRSYDLVRWEHVSYVYETLDDTPQQKLEGDWNIYGKGMWAASLRYHNGVYYVCFVANDTQKTYLYTSENIKGPWNKRYIDGFYHDNSILFDDDDRTYIIYGHRQIYITELFADLSGPKPNGFHKMVLSDNEKAPLGYEGCHIYKIHGRYVIMTCHMPIVNAGRKVQSCFLADNLDGIFSGGIVISDDRKYRNLGVAQGCLVDTPDGKWYSMLFQDVGGAGRIPVLCPVIWENGFPIFGDYGLVPEKMEGTGARPDYQYQPLLSSDDFHYTTDEHGKIRLKYCWQWNHNPDPKLWSVMESPGSLRIHTGKLCKNVTQAVNTLTQRMLFPKCHASVTIDAANIKNGDSAGFAALQGCYGMIALTREDNQFFITLTVKPLKNRTVFPDGGDDLPGTVLEKRPVKEGKISFAIAAEFGETRDYASFYYMDNGKWVQLGAKHELVFKLDHFTGCRFALALYATKEIGGYADFQNFRISAKQLQTDGTLPRNYRHMR
jgi:beta-xylosidase